MVTKINSLPILQYNISKLSNTIVNYIDYSFEVELKIFYLGKLYILFLDYFFFLSPL